MKSKDKFKVWYMMLRLATNKIFMKSWQMKHSSWDPKQDFVILKTLLQTHGPQIVGGALGSQYYDSEKKCIFKEDENSIVYYWPAGSYIPKKEDAPRHTIIIVGATKKDDQEFVFYLDPIDDSLQGEKRKVYIMSYKLLCKYVTNTKGVINLDLLSKSKSYIYPKIFRFSA